jgi:hypothetical protein
MSGTTPQYAGPFDRPVVEPDKFPVGALVRILRDDSNAPVAYGAQHVARVVGAMPSGTLALKIDGAGGGRVSNAYAPPCATQLAFVDGELERLTLEACERLVRADRAAADAMSAQQRLWKSDRAGRRVRGRAVAIANRSSSRALAELVALVQRPDVPPVVAHHFAVVAHHFAVAGPTYYDAAAAAIRAGRFRPAPPSTEGDPT